MKGGEFTELDHWSPLIWAFRALAEPRDVPALLTQLTRTGDVALLDAMTTLALTVEATDAVRASAWFHKAVALALANEPDAALRAVHHARRLDANQIAAWLGLLVGGRVGRWRGPGFE